MIHTWIATSAQSELNFYRWRRGEGVECQGEEGRGRSTSQSPARVLSFSSSGHHSSPKRCPFSTKITS
ncbi:hypothetical protein PS2_036337 [Malus domestica]